ncbi:TPM domain-containing protein [Halalkalibacter hemicellulosilyticus]|uniref:TPM domain-containing protein n=1 Tax=Halalkalibacter hemicellulosilyticusJCM 9152 TaxID=1236971 RepID=W4QEE1_9BACI|nr:TPM domain-containing protein [Halalkalibacter hemicellulosilyticus]GAE30430.1 hypothetical protein JCM9152_1838 [Halalkalibacter hemicellulosilyticusJCM 9152]
MKVEAAVSIIDEGEFFSESEIESLKEQFEDSENDYYIETLMSLGGQSISQFAADTLQEVRSEGYSAVVVISNEEGEIHMEVAEETNVDLVIGSSSIESILDETFIPEAINGHFADGIHALLTHIESLERPDETIEAIDESETDSRAENTAPVESAPPSHGSDSTESSSTSGDDRETSNFTLLLTCGLIIVIYFWTKRRKTRKYYSFFCFHDADMVK